MRLLFIAHTETTRNISDNILEMCSDKYCATLIADNIIH